MIVPAGGSVLEALKMYTWYFEKAYKRVYNLII